MSTPEPGLRELKKQMTHDTIAEAAFRLVVERGLDQVTIDDIAQEAFVSPRTVSNYFAGKEEAVVTAAFRRWDAVVERFCERPRDERPLHALCQVTSDFARELSGKDRSVMVKAAELEQRYPALVPYQTAQYARLEDALREAIAERSDTSVEREMYPWLVAASAVSAIKTALRLWVQTGAGADLLPELLTIAFNELSDGLPVPHVADVAHAEAV